MKLVETLEMSREWLKRISGFENAEVVWRRAATRALLVYRQHHIPRYIQSNETMSAILTPLTEISPSAT